VAAFRGRYHTALGAARIFKKVGGFEALVEGVCLAAGLPSVDPKLACRGDVVGYDSINGFAAGVCLGPKAMFTGRREFHLCP